jgi:hypothetical protein
MFPDAPLGGANIEIYTPFLTINLSGAVVGYLNSEQQFQLCDGGEPSADNVRQQPPFRRGTAGGIDTNSKLEII